MGLALKYRLIIIAIIIITALSVSLCHAVDGNTVPHEAIEHPDYGNLMEVTTPPLVDSRLLHYKGMDISFNPSRHIPNWVAWELTADEIDGTEPRSAKFFSDESVEGCAEPYDYNYSGYDRGHMAPAADMKWDKNAMRETFYMTNICPQAKALNSGTWKKLEEKCRLWAQADDAIYIVCGPIYDNSPIEYIGDSRVYVPRRFFKAIISPYADPPRGIGFIMPNGKVPGGMQAAAVTIDEIEEITGYDFFASLPDEIENKIESQKNFHQWSTIRSK